LDKWKASQKVKINDPNWVPCYLNPSFDELKELAASKWDTCRILVNDKNGDMIIASGYGNCHSSMQDRYMIYLGGTRREDGKVYLKRSLHPNTDTYILYHINGIAFMNLEDVSGPERARYDRWPLDELHLEKLRDLVQLSDLAL